MAARQPRPPSRSRREAMFGRFAAPGGPNPNRPRSVRARMLYRMPADTPTRPSSSAAPQRARVFQSNGEVVRPHSARPLTSRRKGALVGALRRDKIVNALFLKLQSGGDSPELKRLAKVAAGGIQVAPPSLLRLVQEEADKLLKTVDDKSPRPSARTSRIPSQLRRCLSPSRAPKPGSFAAALSEAQHNICQTLAARARVAAEEAARGAAKVSVSDAPPEVRPQLFKRAPRAMVNICGKNVELMEFLREKVMARGKTDSQVIQVRIHYWSLR